MFRAMFTLMMKSAEHSKMMSPHKHFAVWCAALQSSEHTSPYFLKGMELLQKPSPIRELKTMWTMCRLKNQNFVSLFHIIPFFQQRTLERPNVVSKERKRRLLWMCCQSTTVQRRRNRRITLSLQRHSWMGFNLLCPWRAGKINPDSYGVAIFSARKLVSRQKYVADLLQKQWKAHGSIHHNLERNCKIDKRLKEEVLKQANNMTVFCQVIAGCSTERMLHTWRGPIVINRFLPGQWFNFSNRNKIHYDSLKFFLNDF